MTGAGLDAILSATRGRIAALRARAGELERRAASAPAPRPFTPALGGERGERGGGTGGATVGVIAEVKRRSPSTGAIREDLDPARHAASYQRGGAVAISVLTDETYFGGSLDDLARVVQAVSVPVLRKDFILDELQLLEARAAGASAVLLIVRALAIERLQALARTARDHGLGVLVEVHSEAELDQALAVAPTAVGVNSRDLATFAVDLRVAEALLARVPAGVPAVAESGIETRADVERMAAVGADLVLVGTSVARTEDPAAAVRALTGVARRGRCR
jgi:indole-3-glycerol phosphate synthase